MRERVVTFGPGRGLVGILCEPDPAPSDDNTEIGYAAKDNDYRQTIYELAPDDALVMRGRFPRCRFANVVLWNHRLQTPPYRHRRVSLNRRQVHYERDGSFELVFAVDTNMNPFLTAKAKSYLVSWKPIRKVKSEK